MAKGATPLKSPSDEEVRLLLVLYKCPTPFHAVRTRILGSIASPILHLSPLEAVKGLWGGELLGFNSIGSLSTLMCTLEMGLWNRLARHQDRRIPFRLLRVTSPTTREALSSLALIRREELEGFVAGLLGSKEEVHLPERAHRALIRLADIRDFFHAVHGLASDAAKTATPADIADTLGSLRTLGRIAEQEIHEAVLSCTWARREGLRGSATKKPTLH